jgi:hypothetical protein
MYTILVAAVEYIIISMPVAEATVGGRPILNSKGLNITPPPSPNAPDTQPPRKANITRLTKVYP